MQTQLIALDKIEASSVNPRKSKTDKVADAALAGSIDAIGILQPPIVRPNGTGNTYTIVAGSRRIEACRSLKFTEIACLVSEFDDQAASIAAVTENTHRVQMDAMDQFEAYAKLSKDGMTAESIAEQFGIKSDLVRRRLRLGALDPQIIKAYRKGEIDLDACMMFTLGNKSDQRKVLKGGGTMAWQIKRQLTGGKIKMSNAIFDPALYGGKTISDLFGDEVYALDTEHWLELQTTAIKNLTEIQRHHYLFVGWTNLPRHEIKSLDGKKLVEGYTNDEKASKTARKKYGKFYHLHEGDGAVSESFGWTFKEAKAKVVREDGTEVKPKDDGGLTAKQDAIMAHAYQTMFRNSATLEEGLRFYILKNASGQTAKQVMKMMRPELETLFIEMQLVYANDYHADPDIVQLGESNAWSLRAHWTPDEEFIKPYKASMLEKIGKKIGINLSGCKTKAEKVRMLVVAFKANPLTSSGPKGFAAKAATWLP